jgi:hypothetical protein
MRHPFCWWHDLASKLSNLDRTESSSSVVRFAAEGIDSTVSSRGTAPALFQQFIGLQRLFTAADDPTYPSKSVQPYHMADVSKKARTAMVEGSYSKKNGSRKAVSSGVPEGSRTLSKQESVNIRGLCPCGCNHPLAKGKVRSLRCLHRVRAHRDSHRHTHTHTQRETHIDTHTHTQRLT